jgi:hypothetical protein
MLNAVLVVVGAVALWVVVDRLLCWRDQRLQRGRAAWSALGMNRTFHSTGWEETAPPPEADGGRDGPRQPRSRHEAAA